MSEQSGEPEDIVGAALPPLELLLRPQTLFVTDAELIRRIGVPEKIAREALRALDLDAGKRSGFPQKNKLWGNRRYWPAVEHWFLVQNHVITARQRASAARRDSETKK